MAEYDFTGIDDVEVSEAPVQPKLDVEPDLSGAASAGGGVTDDEWAALDKEAQSTIKYGDRPLEAGTLAAASTASFSLSDRVLEKSGIYSKEDLQEMRKRNPGADIAGTIAGAVAPALISGGTGGAAATTARIATGPATAAIKAGAATEKLVASALAKSAAKGAARSIIKESLAKGAGAAVEGAAFGTGQLLREEALGDAELNAENLLSHAGTGALFGGLIGGAAPVIGAAAGKVGSGVKTQFEKIATKYADPRKAAQELTGFNLRKLLKLESNKAGKELLEDLPRWYVEDVGLTLSDKADDIVRKVSTLKEEAGSSIDDLLAQADTVAASRITDAANSPSFKKDILQNIAKRIEDDYVKPYEGYSSLKAQVRKVQQVANDLYKQSNEGGANIGAALTDVKRKMDIIAKNFYDRAPGAAQKLGETAAFKARSLVNEATQRYVDFVDPQLAAQLRKANQNYHYAKTVGNSLLKKSVQDKQLISFKDALFGALGYGIGEKPGLAVLGIKKFAESDFRRKLAILTGIKKTSDTVTAKIGSAMKDFAAATSKPSRLAALQILNASPLAVEMRDNLKSEAPKNRKEAFSNIQNNLQTFIAEGDKLLDHSVRSGASISLAAPATATAVGHKLITAVQFLQSKVPKRPYEAELPGAKARPYEPSSMELAKFERYLQVVEHPLSVLDDLKSGTLTQEHVEALRAVYPKLYSLMQSEALDMIRTSSDTDMSYAKKVQISMLLNIPGDSSLLAKNILALQQNFQVQEQPQGGSVPVVQPTQGGAKNLKHSERAASDTQAFLQRRGQS